jgi:hypothetical protein
MLFWEALQKQMEKGLRELSEHDDNNGHVQRLPFDTRCVARTKSGHRCRGRVRKGSDFCPFHDPAISAEQRRANAAKAARSRKRLSQFPDGYLRKLNSPASVAEAMDRLYREVRLGFITPQMGRVLLDILNRLAHAHGANGNGKGKRTPSRKKIAHIQPRLTDLLTRRERAAWREAAASAAQRPGETSPSEAVSGQSIGAIQDLSDRCSESDELVAPLVLTRVS